MAALAAASGMSAAGMRAAGTYASAGAAYSSAGAAYSSAGSTCSSAGSTCSSVCACLPRADTLAAGVNASFAEAASLAAPASFSGMPVCF